ncbi:MAG: hypothetical protein HRK26_01765 [Rickettsiaceae bacterium H1]|nr:hypothetical protein [Rickettsiaceae bacterium H1]
MKKFHIVFFVILIFFSGMVGAVCICDETPGVRSAKKEVAAVFYGRVEKKIWINPFDYLVKIKIHRSWKSIREEYLWLASTKFDKECGFDFVTGHEYLIYAYNVTDNLLAVSKCGRTQEWQEVNDQEKHLLGKLIYVNEAN